MQIAFCILFALILVTITVFIFLFKGYKKDYINSIESTSLPPKFITGLASYCTDLLYHLPFFRKSALYNKTRKLTSAIDVGMSSDKSTYLHHLKITSNIIIVLSISSLLGFTYTISFITSDADSVAELSRPLNGDGNQNISLKTDSELYSGIIDITVEDEKYTFDEVMKIFSGYRADFDSYVLSNNISFLHVDSPLNLPNTWGDEEISVSWFISQPDVIDYTGNLIRDNIVSSGVSVEITATLTLDEISADICYQLIVYPPKVTDKELVENYLNKFINSEKKRTDDVVELPENILGFDISYSSPKEVYPTLDIYYYGYHNLYTCNHS